MEQTVRMLNAANITYALECGSLLGAYRHGGPLACDGDMDIVFPVWLNDLVKCSDGPGTTLCGLERGDYIKPAMIWLRERIPSVSISPRHFGGFRANFAGIGVDWIVSINDFHDDALCICAFGSTTAICVQGAEMRLRKIYGPSFMTPDSHCHDHKMKPRGEKPVKHPVKPAKPLHGVIDVSAVQTGLSKNSAFVRKEYTLTVPHKLTFNAQLHTVAQDGGNHDPRWVSHDTRARKSDAHVEDINVTAIVARKDDHNPFFMFSLVYNVWCMSKSVIRVVFLDECIPSNMTSMWDLVFPGIEQVCISSLAGTTSAFSPALIGVSEYAGDLMQNLNHNNWVAPRNKRLRQFTQMVKERAERAERAERHMARIIVSRRHTNQRKLGRIWVNEAECAKELRAEPVVYEDHSLVDQIQISAGAQTMIGMHGAGLVHALWLEPGSTLLEIFPKNKRRWGYRNIANMLGLRYIEYRGGRDTTAGKVVPMSWCSSSNGDHAHRVLDAVHINHEVDVYALRHAEYQGIVDEFHVFEGSVTQRGELKNSTIRDVLPPGVHYHSIPKPPNYEACRSGSWSCENHDRAYIADTMARLVGPNDVFITSDVDEVASAGCLRDAIQIKNGCMSLNTPVWKYSFNWKDPRSPNWHTLKVCSGVDTKTVISKHRYGLDGNAQTSRYPSHPGICGWHMSTFGTINEIQRKVLSIIEGVGRHYDDRETLRRVNAGISLVKKTRRYIYSIPTTLPRIAALRPEWFRERFMRWPGPRGKTLDTFEK